MQKITIPQTAVEEIAQILARGSDAEVKKVRGEVVVVEIRRKLRIKSPVQVGTGTDRQG